MHFHPGNFCSSAVREAMAGVITGHGYKRVKKSQGWTKEIKVRWPGTQLGPGNEARMLTVA